MAEATGQKERADDVVSRVEEASRTADARMVGGQERPIEQDGAQNVIAKAATSPKAAQALTDQERMDAMDWLLSTGEDEQPIATQVWELNVGTDEQPRLIEWTIRPVDTDTITLLRQRGRQEAGMNREMRRAGLESEIDMGTLNLRLIVAGTVYPNLQAAAEQKGVAAADPYHGPVLLLRSMFSRKPGLIDQLAGYIYRFSGYDEADMRRATPEMTMIQAAGN